jgi:hypothetical protein
MGGIPSHETHHLQKPTTRGSFSQRTNYPDEILCLRNEIKNKMKITLDRRYVFLLYFPPDYHVAHTAEYLSFRLGLPIDSSVGQSADYFLTEIATNEVYKHGCIICNYPVSVADVGSLKRHLESENAQLYLLYFDVDAEVRLTDSPSHSPTPTDCPDCDEKIRSICSSSEQSLLPLDRISSQEPCGSWNSSG